jgi:polyhydroxybutyrate depolymerase
MMAHRLACELPGRFAAIAPVAGGAPTSLAGRCAGAPVSILAIQGTADRLVPYEGGGVAGSRGEVMSAAASVAHWAGVAGCVPAPVTTPLPDRAPRDGTTVRRTEYRGCGGRSISLYTVAGGGHTWPGGAATSLRLMGRTSRDISASREIWRFFAAHPRP